MSEQDPGDFAEEFHRDRREHGGASQRLDDDQLARLTEEERVAAGLDAYDPDEVPPATDTPPQPEDITQTEEWQEERAEVRRELDKDEIGPIAERQPFPPTRYELRHARASNPAIWARTRLRPLTDSIMRSCTIVFSRRNVTR
jgi:hypothetical protein